jgi:hypothetical protein
MIVMKKIFFRGFILVFLFAVSCRKADVSNCYRLTAYDYYSGTGDFHQIDRFAYKNGLLDEVTTFSGLRYSIGYDAQSKLATSRVYDGDSLLYIISFVYKNGKVAEEIWRYATSQQIYDDVFLTYDQQGRLARNESFMLEYHTDNTYYPDGSLKRWLVVDHGANFAQGDYTYEDNYKNPFSSITGVDYSFWATNSAFGIRMGNRWYTSEKITLFDENNQPYALYEQDPAKTTWKMGQPLYPLESDYVDKLTGDSILNIFSYESCDGGSLLQPARSSRKTSVNESGHVRTISPYIKVPGKQSTNTQRITPTH